MAREYTVTATEVATTTAQDLFEVRPADDKGCEVYGLFIAQSSDFGDAQAELIPYTVLRGHTETGSGGSTPTPEPLDPGDAAAGFSAEANNTTAAKGGTAKILHASAFNVAVGEALWLPNESGWKLNQGNTSLVVRLTNPPVDSLDLSITLYVREF